MAVDFTFLLQNQNYQALLIEGVRLTLVIFACTWVLGMALGITLATLRAFDWPPLNFLVAAYVEYHRNVPALIQLFVWYFGIASLLPREVNDFINYRGAETIFAIIAFSANKAAYISEDLRSGLRAIPPTQMEAARAMGLSYFGAMRWVILPQTWRIAFPSLANQTLFAFKMSALGAAIGAHELTYQARKIENLTYRIFEVYSVATVLYLIGSFTIMATGAWLATRVRLRRK